MRQVRSVQVARSLNKQTGLYEYEYPSLSWLNKPHSLASVVANNSLDSIFFMDKMNFPQANLDGCWGLNLESSRVPEFVLLTLLKNLEGPGDVKQVCSTNKSNEADKTIVVHQCVERRSGKMVELSGSKVTEPRWSMLDGQRAFQFDEISISKFRVGKRPPQAGRLSLLFGRLRFLRTAAYSSSPKNKLKLI